MAFAMVGIVAALLFGDLAGARADAPAEPPAAEPTAVSTTPDPGIATHTVTFRPIWNFKLPTITCELKLALPRAVEFQYVRAEGDAECSETVEEIYFSIELRKLSTLMAYDEYTAHDVASFGIIMGAACTKGIWHAEADAIIVAGPGYESRPAHIWDVSGDVTLNIDANCRALPTCPLAAEPKCREP